MSEARMLPDSSRDVHGNVEQEPQAVCGFTSDDLAQVMSDLLPQGWVWPRDPDSVQQQVLAALAVEYARLYRRDCDLLDESYPCNALETITDWERVLGLPDPCTGALETLQQRRMAICAKLSTVANATLPGLVAYLNNIGYQVEIEEGPGRFDFIVWVGTSAPIWFRASQSVAYERIRTWGDKMLECAIEYAKQAHTRPEIHYLVPTEWDDASTIWDGGDTVWDEGIRGPIHG